MCRWRLDVIADILRNPVFDENEIEIERGVILQEIGQALDTPDDIIFDWLQEKRPIPIIRWAAHPGTRRAGKGILASRSASFVGSITDPVR